MNQAPSKNDAEPDDAIRLLTRPAEQKLTAEEDLLLSQELSAAYHMDEIAATSRDVQRIAEKVRARLANPPSEERPKP